ncbi:MAG: hypothetical protein PF445_07240 [Melioribacteraceae bacterium]|jgi:hypothetical protein|nr:hypothetical protein [Melioribacteraceae bacterium]
MDWILNIWRKYYTIARIQLVAAITVIVLALIDLFSPFVYVVNSENPFTYVYLFLKLIIVILSIVSVIEVLLSTKANQAKWKNRVKVNLLLGIGILFVSSISLHFDKTILVILYTIVSIVFFVFAFINRSKLDVEDHPNFIDNPLDTFYGVFNGILFFLILVLFFYALPYYILSLFIHNFTAYIIVTVGLFFIILLWTFLGMMLDPNRSVDSKAETFRLWVGWSVFFIILFLFSWWQA